MISGCHYVCELSVILNHAARNRDSQMPQVPDIQMFPVRVITPQVPDIQTFPVCVIVPQVPDIQTFPYDVRLVRMAPTYPNIDEFTDTERTCDSESSAPADGGSAMR